MDHRLTQGVAALAAGWLVSLAGCGARVEPTLSPDAFVSRRTPVGPGSGEPVDKPGPVVYDAQHAPTHTASGAVTISQTVRDNAQVPATAPARTPNVPETNPSPATNGAATEPTQPATGLANGTGGYQVLGVVLCEVNGRPIFADKVLAKIDHLLAAEARKRDAREFRAYALDQIIHEMNVEVGDEVEFAAADKALEKSDRDIAHMATMEWRRNAIRQASGSEALARQQRREIGVDFDEETREQYRQIIVLIYRDKKLSPLIQVNAADVRRAYEKNIRKYTKVQPGFKFRVIKVADMATAGQVMEKVRAGEDFAELAGKFNQEPLLKSSKGAVGEDGWMEKDGYRVDEVNKAVDELQPGQVSKPIEADGGVCLVKLEAVGPGVVEPFESVKVQEEITKALKDEQFTEIHYKHNQQLRRNSVIVDKPGMEEVAADMAMQRYPLWASAK